MKKQSASDVIYLHLKDCGKKTTAELVSEFEFSTTCVNNALMRLKNRGLIGKQDNKWGAGQKHRPNKSVKTQVVNMIQKGTYTVDEMAEKIGVPRKKVSDEISRLKTIVGFKIKRVYIFED
jgi:uncharacterized protein YidB (DUF937 family)